MKKTTLIAMLVAAALPCARGAGVDWSNSLLDPLPLIDTNGNALDSTFAFEFGTFTSGFTPTIANMNSWAANWKTLSRADTGNGQWVDSDPFFGPHFGNSFQFNSNGTVIGQTGGPTFSKNEQAYLWVFNNNEWALVTDTSAGSTGDDIWLLPDPVDTAAPPLVWNIETADTAIIGQVNGVPANGPYNFNAAGNFRLQTQAIPEPGSALLLLAAGCLLQISRHRRRTAMS